MNPYEPSKENHSLPAPVHDDTVHDDTHNELKAGKDWIATGIVIGVIANLGALGSILPLIAVQPGSAIRPMGPFAAASCFSMLGISLGLPTCLAGMYFKRSGRDALGWIGVGTNLCALVLPLLAINLICWALDITISD